MSVSVYEQLRQIAAGLLAGGGGGLFLDLLFRALRWLPEPWETLGEALGLFFCAGWFFRTGQWIGAGMRLFFLCACAAGIALYRVGPGRAVAALFGVLTRIFPGTAKKRK